MKNYRIIISEPFDFKNDDKTNIISGKIIRDISESEVLFESVNMLEFNGIVSNKFLLKTRHQNEKLNNNNDYKNIINGLIIKNYSDESSLNEIREHSSFVFIGYLE
jgi:hypothetical protein